MNRFSIYAWPAYATKKLNPYNYIIYKHIEEQGYPVFDFAFGRRNQLLRLIFSRNIKVLHIHWPTSNLLRTDSYLYAWYRVISFYLFVRTIKLLDKKILWTVHNIEEHEPNFPMLHSLIDKILYNNVDGFISMNQRGMDVIREKMKSGDRQRISYIHHPHYRDYYQNTLSCDAARKKLNIPDGAFVFLFVGQVRNYKNIPTLIKAFRQLNDPNTMLVIAGKVYKDVSASELQRQIGDCSRILFINAFIEEDEVQTYLNAADLVVNPYSKIFNSGSVFLNLSFNKPTLAPDMYAISELKQTLGSQWIKTYSNDITADTLRKTMQEVKREKKKGIKLTPAMDIYNPEIIAKSTIEFYKTIVQKKHRN